nr:hypothetical protein [Microbacterium sp.]
MSDREQDARLADGFHDALAFFASHSEWLLRKQREPGIRYRQAGLDVVAILSRDEHSIRFDDAMPDG